MANDLLKKLEEKINEAIETIELSRMEVTDLKEQNEESWKIVTQIGKQGCQL